MRLTNTSKRSIALSPTLAIQPNQTIILEADARWVLGRPMIKAYLDDGILVAEAASNAGAVEAEPAAAAPAKPRKTETKDGDNG